MKFGLTTGKNGYKIDDVRFRARRDFEVSSVQFKGGREMAYRILVHECKGRGRVCDRNYLVTSHFGKQLRGDYIGARQSLGYILRQIKRGGGLVFRVDKGSQPFPGAAKHRRVGQIFRTVGINGRESFIALQKTLV